MEWMGWLYAGVLGLMSLFGLHLAVLLALAIWHRRPPNVAPPPAAAEWPTVLVQLPIFNERYVVERLIDAAAALDYPADRLHIQVLDDSSDDTGGLARACVAYHRARGKWISYHLRATRTGFKAGALAEGLALEDGVGRSPASPAEFVAVFDADFVPPPDCLRRLLPPFFRDARLGLVQARWEHLNREQNLATRAQALAFDSYFAVEQAARCRAGLLMNFNGSAGVWRRACIEDAGGWQADTLAEDLDLSYRAQLRGWRLAYQPEVAIPAELPPSILTLKRQQFRWAKGSFQVLRKLGPTLLGSDQPWRRKVFGVFHLAGYLPYPLAVLSLLLSLPVVLMHGRLPFNWELLGWTGLVSPLMTVWGQWRWRALPGGEARAGRLLAYPIMLLGAIGLALNNTRAFLEAFSGEVGEFQRTPKFHASLPSENLYALSIDWSVWGELLLALYALATGLLAVDRAPQLLPMLILYALAFGMTAARGLWESAGVGGAAEARETAK